MPGSSDSVKVAVRVRPFNQREKNAGSGCVISMSGKSTTIKNPETGDTKTFAFDHSYWSHDGYKENDNGVYTAEPSTNYADQRQVFSDLGQGVLDNAWQGYNAALFAYGQTGSGKSYSMIGYGPNKGIVPITCEELFKAVESNKDENKELQVSFSMLEIYNEQVRDLLVKGKQQGGLKIRQNPNAGFYVEGLKQVPVRDYKEIEKLMEQGTVNRTTASTNMNATSSRSHMVITIRFAQIIKNVAGERNTRSSDINLVDLAGSERADSTGATGDRLKEGSAINQSLSTLGNVISALADLAMGKKKVLVPYRDSVLTKLLQSALGGNSRTIMIAALSPAAINYDETLSTLRYADRAKKIQNRAVVNESPTDRMIRELKEENARLMAALQKQGGKKSNTDDLQNLLQENELRLQEINMTWEQRLDQAKREWERSHDSPQHHEWETLPYFMNINEDSQLNGVVKHCFKPGMSIFGRGSKVTFTVRGLGIQENHAIIEHRGLAVEMEPVSNSKIYVNGHKIKGRVQLKHLSRIKLGSNCLFLFVGPPKERKPDDQMEQYDYDFFMMELAEHEGVAVDIHTSLVNDSTDNLKSVMIFQEYIDLLPQISEANAISDELRKDVYFEPEVKSASSHDPQGRAMGKEVLIRLTNRKTKKKGEGFKVWVWTKSKFLHRKDLMDEMYVRWMEGGNVNVPRDKDPFWDPVEDIFLGSCHVMLQSLSYCVDIDEHFTLHNYHGKEEAVIHVKIFPTDTKGEFLGEDSIVEPKELLRKRFDFKIILPQCMGIRWIMEDSTRGIFCKMSFNNQPPVCTKTVWGKSYADIHFERQFTEKNVTQSFINYLQTHSLVLELWGTQDPDERVSKVGNGKISSHIDEVEKSADILTQLKVREEQLETLNQECENMRKENFTLKQSLYKQKQQTDLLRANTRRDAPSSAPPCSKDGRRPSTDISSVMSVGLDADLAQALRLFFRDVKVVQQHISDMKEYVKKVQTGSDNNGGMKSALQKQESSFTEVDRKLTKCVDSLKDSVKNTLRKSKS